MDSQKILTVKDLRTFFFQEGRCNRAVNGVSFNLHKGRTLCVVGESGCGKSVTASSVMRLLPDFARIETGSITYHSKDGDIEIEKLRKNGSEMRRLRGGDIAMIFQDPMASLNPVYTIGFQISEMLLQHTQMTKQEAMEKSIQLLSDMGIAEPEIRVNEYPHQFSGGMRQRVMIAMAMACNPKILIADEPTTALDVTIQAQIFELMKKLKDDYETAIMLITHDMGVVSELADDVAVMYMGNIVEFGTVDQVLQSPKHPYTVALLDSMPVLGKGRDQFLKPIRGSTPDPYDRPVGCQFQPRCDFSTKQCETCMPDSYTLNDGHWVRCFNVGRDNLE